MIPKIKGVMMVLSGFYPYVGGAEEQARAVAAEMRRRGIPVWVLTRRIPGTDAESLVDLIPVTRLPAPGSGPFAAAVFSFFVFLELLLRRNDYDVIHAHLASAHSVACALAGKLLGKKVIVKLAGGKGHGEVATSKDTFLGGLKLSALGALRPVLAAPNVDLFDELKGTPLEHNPRIHIPNGVDLKKYAPAPPEEKAALRKALGWDGFALLSASRLDSDKGVAQLLSEFITVWGATEHKTASLYIAGTGPKEAELKHHAREVHTRVKFLGARKDMHVLFKAADAFVLPSKAEGMSNALLEAMACGLPVLATNVSGTQGLVTDGEDGLLYHPGDIENLHATLNRLVTEPGLAPKLGAAARARVEQYSLPHTVDKWLELYGSARL